MIISTAIGFILFAIFVGEINNPQPLPEITGWTPYKNNPVFKSDPKLLDGIFSDPWVIKDGDTYVMYYGATKGDFSDTNTVSIFRATSKDGINWERNSIPLFSKGPNGNWDSVKVETPSIIKLFDGSYRMYYAGSNLPDSEASFQMGVATSPDGITWKKHKGNPVLRLGKKGDFDEISIFEPSVLYKDEEYWMWYAGMSKELKVAFGLAKSKDGITWEKKGMVMQLDVEKEGRKEVGLLEDHVIWNGNNFEMFYAVLQDEGQVVNPIWHAVSDDGVNWIKDNGPILRKGDENSWTGQGISAPSILLEDTVYRMWYVGSHTDGKTFFKGGIGLAEKNRD